MMRLSASSGVTPASTISTGPRERLRDGAFNSSLGFLGVWVEPTASDTDTKVTAVLKTRTPFPAMTENGFHDRLANAVVKKASP